jgi:hypothetical protein
VTFSSDSDYPKAQDDYAPEVDEDLAALERIAPHEERHEGRHEGRHEERYEERHGERHGERHEKRHEEPRRDYRNESSKEMESKFDSLLGMLDERFADLTSRSSQLEKIVEQLARSQLAMADQAAATPPAPAKPEEPKSADFYGKIGCKTLPFFVDMPPASLETSGYEEACDCLANQGEWIMLGDPQVHPETQASWYPARHIDPATGKRSTFWAPAALDDEPCFERFAAYPV